MFHAKLHDYRTISSVGKVLKVFYHIWVWQSSWSGDLEFLSAVPMRFHIQFGFDWPSGFVENCFLEMVALYMYIVHGQGQTTPWGQIYSLTHLVSQLSHLLHVFTNK